MSDTILTAEVEIAHRRRRGSNVNVLTVSQDQGELKVTQPSKDVLQLVARAHKLDDPESGSAYIGLNRTNAESLCRNLAVRLGLKVEA